MTIKRMNRIIWLVSIVVIFVFVGLSVHHFMDFQREERAWETEKERLVKVEKEIVQIEKSLSLYRQEQEEFLALLFAEKDVPVFLESISKFAQDAGVSILDMKTKKFAAVVSPSVISESQSAAAKNRAAKNKKPLSHKDSLDRLLTMAAMPIQVKVKSTFPEFVTFLNQLEDFKQLLSVSEVEIVRGKDFPALDCRFIVKIYSFKDLEELENAYK
jgi:hypothetical protein